MILQSLRLVYVLVLIGVLFVPFGAYHSMSEPYIQGYLWGYNLPVGYAGLVSGIVAILFPKLPTVRKLRFGSVMILLGLFLLLSFFFSPKDYFINLLRGTRFDGSQIDIDSPIGNSVVWGLSLFSVASGSLLRTRRIYPAPS